MSILVYYAHMMYLMLYAPVPTLLLATTTLLRRDEQQMMYKMTSTHGANAFLGILGVLTIAYGAYYACLFANVVNKRLYWTYFGLKGNELRVHPLRWAACAVGALALSRFSVFPFGALYVYALAYYMRIHISILAQINVEGAL
jgi:hypothetical protein